MSLQSSLNPAYSKNAAILTGNPNRVTVEVEDNIDALFWSDLLEGLQLGKDFHFSPYCTIQDDDSGAELKKVTGKSRIMKNAKDFNENHIGCVDSDYDWLLSDKTPYGKDICGNKYLLHTYAYSIENLLCLAETLDCFCEEMTDESSEGVLRDYVGELSSAVYPLLLWSAYLCGEGCRDFTPATWRAILVNTQKNPEDSLAEVKKQIELKLKSLECEHARDRQEKDQLATALTHGKSITPDNAYLFVRGHDLFDHLVYSVVGPVVSYLRQKHYKQLRESTDAKKDEKMKEYQRKQVPVKDLLYKNSHYKEWTDFYDKIASDAKRIWS